MSDGPRRIVQRHRGERHGPITRLVSPGDLGEALKPFVFLDFIQARITPGFGFGFHPHSGIATLTYQLDCDVQYEDTAGQKGIVERGGLEWMQAGSGVWHQGHLTGSEQVTGFQLWIALPAGVEDGPSQGRYAAPAAVPSAGPVKVLLGRYGGVASPIDTPAPMHYFDVVLAAGERWTYTPPPGFDVAWLFAYSGSVDVAGSTSERELLVFDHSEASIGVQAMGDARLVFGAAPRHLHDLVLGQYSVHTNARSLAGGEQRIAEIGRTLALR